jgi:hypothetical protein
MKYHITEYTKKQARRLGVQVFPSEYKQYKIKVITPDGYHIYVGASGYKDYPTYIKEKGVEYANQRRRLYKTRHEKDRHKVGSRGYYADQLLW